MLTVHLGISPTEVIPSNLLLLQGNLLPKNGVYHFQEQCDWEKGLLLSFLHLICKGSDVKKTENISFGNTLVVTSAVLKDCW